MKLDKVLILLLVLGFTLIGLGILAQEPEEPEEPITTTPRECPEEYIWLEDQQRCKYVGFSLTGDWIPGVPNWLLLVGAGVLGWLMLDQQGGAKK